MGYLIAVVIGIVVVYVSFKIAFALIKYVFKALWEFLKIVLYIVCTVLKFLWDNWQLPIGFLCGWLYDEKISKITKIHIDNKIVSVAVMILFCYLLTFVFRGIGYFIALYNEKSLEYYLKNHCSKLGYISVEQLCEHVKGYESRKYNCEFKTIVEEFLNNTTSKHYDINNSGNWSNLYNYLENKTCNGMAVLSPNLFRDCAADFSWTSNMRKEKILFMLLRESKLPIFANYDIQMPEINGQKVFAISNLSEVEVCEGDWG